MGTRNHTGFHLKRLQKRQRHSFLKLRPLRYQRLINMFRFPIQSTRLIQRSCVRMASAAAEPLRPSMLTTFPGPKTLQLKDQMSTVQENSAVAIFADYDKSQGNYMV